MNRITLLTSLFAGALCATNWPVARTDTVHPLGNNWGEYQNYGGGGYFHNGIDVFPDHQGDPVYAVAHGWVKAWGTIQAEYHYRLAISDSPPQNAGRCPGWLYAHVDPNRPRKNVGDEVQEGELIGYLVPWPVTGFDHCHFARISDTGASWNRFPNPTWWFTHNPLTIITPNIDTRAPVIQDAVTGQRFAICRNNTNTYLDINNLTGDVDIVVRAYDETGYPTSSPTWDRLVPYKYVWSVRGTFDSVPPRLGVIFSGLLPDYLVTNITGVIYKTASPCRSYGDYDRRDYFVIASNNDGDSTIEATDTSGCWRTAQLPDDYYWVKVAVYDVCDNVRVDSMRVRLTNGNSIAEVGQPSTRHDLTVPTVARRGRDLTLAVSLTRSQPVRLQVFDPTGRLELSIDRGLLPAGRHELRFTPALTGVHLAVLTLEGDHIVHKLSVVD